MTQRKHWCVSFTTGSVTAVFCWLCFVSFAIFAVSMAFVTVINDLIGGKASRDVSVPPLSLSAYDGLLTFNHGLLPHLSFSEEANKTEIEWLLLVNILYFHFIPHNSIMAFFIN